MESKRSRGYIIPSNIAPAGYRCFAMYVPDNDEYFSAFSGHIHQLATWQAWEKDGTTRAAQAAAVWKDAIDLSIEDLWLEAYVMTCENVQQLLDGLANIQVNVNCEGCGGGGCGVTFKDWRVPDTWEDDWNDEPIPESSTPTTEATGTLCDNANSAWYEIDLWLQQFAQNVHNESPYSDMVDDLDNYALDNPYVSWVWQAMNVVVSLAYDDLLTDVSTFWSGLKQEFICKLLEYDNAVDFRAWLFTRIRQFPPTWSAGYYIEVLLTGTTFNPLYDGTYSALPQFIGSDCSICVGDVEEIATGYFMMPVNTLISSSSVNGGQLNHIAGNEWEIIAGANQGYELYPDLTEHGYNWDVNNGTSRMGHKVVVENSTGGSFWMQGGTNIFHGTIQNLSILDDVRGRAAVASPDLDAWLAMADFDAGMTGTGKAGFRFIQGGGAGLQTYRVFLWVVMDAGGQI